VTELASLLQTEYLKHSSIDSASGSVAIRTLSGVNTGIHISGDLTFTGGTTGDITFNNSVQIGVQKYTLIELAILLETEYLKHSSIISVSGSAAIRTFSGVSTGVHISGDLGFTGGTSGDLTFNNSLQTGVQKYTITELATLLETEYLKHSLINSASGSSDIRILYGLDTGARMSGNPQLIGENCLGFTGGLSNDITFNNSLQIGEGLNYISIKTNDVLNSSYTLTLPSEAPSDDKTLKSDSNGNLYWSSAVDAVGESSINGILSLKNGGISSGEIKIFEAIVIDKKSFTINNVTQGTNYTALVNGIQIGNVINSPAIVIDKKSFTINNVTQDSNYTLTIGGTQIGNIVNSRAIVIDQKSFTVSNVTQGTNYTVLVNGIQIGNVVNSPTIVIDQKSFTVSNVTQDSNYILTIDGIQIGNIVNSRAIVIDKKLFTVSNVTENSNYTLTVDGVQIGTVVNSPATVIDQKSFTVSNVTANSNYTLTVNGSQVGNLVNSRAIVIDKKSFTVSNVTSDSNYTLTVDGIQIGNIVNARTIFIDKKLFTINNVSLNSGYFLTVDGIQVGNIVSSYEYFSSSTLYGVTISGQLSDALNPSIKLSNATINILDTNNSIKGSTTTNSNGNYTINVPIGKHILHIIMNGYIGIKDLIDTTESTTYNFSMTQNINTGDIRLVLTWGD